jgi:Secretion system C-terminal sorting domain
MKKTYLFIASLIICSINLNSQTVLRNNTHGIVIGTSHDFIFTNNKDEGLSGANVIWDFSDLVPANKNLTSHMLNPSNLDKSVEIIQANAVIEEFGNHYYFKVTDKGMEQYGTVCCNTVTKFDVPFLKLKFPFAYGDKVSGNYSGTQQSQNAKIAVNGTYEVAGDAYGTLILPGNIAIDNVLRVKQTRTFNNESNGITEITYRWYTDDVRYPLLVVIKLVTPKESYVSQTAVYAHPGDRNKSATSINSSLEAVAFKAFPVPYGNQLTISYSLVNVENVQIDLCDIAGRFPQSVLNNSRQTAGYHEIILSNNDFKLMPGIYYIKLSIGNNVYMKKVIKE